MVTTFVPVLMLLTVFGSVDQSVTVPTVRGNGSLNTCSTSARSPLISTRSRVFVGTDRLRTPPARVAVATFFG